MISNKTGGLIGSSLVLLWLHAAGCSAPSHRSHLGSAAPSTFLDEVGSHSLAQVELSKAALSRADHAPVREFAEGMIEDHIRMHQESLDALSRLDESAPRSIEPEPSQREVVLQIASQEGCAFEADYLACVIADSEALIPVFEEQARSGAHPEVRSFAARQLPVLRAELERALSLLSEVRRTVPQTFTPPPFVLPVARHGIAA